MASANPSGRELITFRIRDQDFCIDIMSVREIRGWTPATALPQAPSFVRGVINLRGAVLPIVDLSDRLGLGVTEPSERHVIIVSNMGSRFVGLLVDGVSDILAASHEDIQATPDVGSETVRNFVQGILPVDGRMITVLALDHILPDFPALAA
jgi:purine-binding chemotaxis protein CheW